MVVLTYGIDTIFRRYSDMIDNVSLVSGYTVTASSIRTGIAVEMNAETASAEAADQYDGLDSVRISGRGKLLANASLLLPTLANVRELAEDVADELGDFFRSNGISGQSPVTFGIDSATGELTVNGDRNDTDRISGLMENDKELTGKVRTLIALSSHASGMQESIRFQKEYLASSNPERVIAKYADLFDKREPVTTALSFDGTDLSILVNGKEWDTGAKTVAELLK